MTAEPRGLLDTSVVILIGDLPDPRALPGEPFVSAVTLAELSVGPLVAKTPGERALRQAHLQQTESDFELIPFDAASARAFAGVSLALRQAGRKPAARAYDALIAATAIAHQLPLFTCNPSDFAGIPRLKVVPVDHPATTQGS